MMEHPVLIKAFEAAQLRATDRGQIFMLCKRANIFYKDTYYVVTGDDKTVAEAIKKLATATDDEKTNHPRADHIDLLDTPFDTWCSGACVNEIKPCDADTAIKCASVWHNTTFNNTEELNHYIQNIKPGYYPMYTVEYL